MSSPCEATPVGRADCGQPSDALYSGTCEHGHEQERPLCAGHALSVLLCRVCHGSGDACEVTLVPVAPPGQVHRG